MIHTKKVSVLMSTYNCEAYVADAIKSILDQTYTNWELIIADDVSLDHSREVIDCFSDPRIIRRYNEIHIGYINTINKLLEASTGEYITWQDADDISFPNRLEKLVDALETDPNLMLCGSNSVRKYKFGGNLSKTDFPLTHVEIIDKIERQHIIPFLGVIEMIRRDVLAEVPGYRIFFEGLGFEDHDFVLRVVERYKVGNIPEVLYEYLYHRKSYSRRISEKNYLMLFNKRIVFFLYEQRKRNNGLDGLMPGGDKESLDRFLEQMKNEFEVDRSIVYRKSCRNKIDNQDFFYACLDACKAIKINPKSSENYSLLFRIPGNFIRTVYQAAGNSLQKKISPTSNG
jgi:glycosyltransferase involved in cell wall biosynthesis